LDWAGAHELLERGFEVGSHTLAHRNLATESADAQVQDLRASKEVLENKLGTQVSVVAYPFGQADAVTDTTARAAAEAGYAHGLTTQAGVNTPKTGATHAHRIMLDPAQGLLRTVATRAHNRLVRRSRPRRSVSR
jgi:peptidoglycan/xylan/chitin deacetylase (PgdA/CDA1 family)